MSEFRESVVARIEAMELAQAMGRTDVVDRYFAEEAPYLRAILTNEDLVDLRPRLDALMPFVLVRAESSGRTPCVTGVAELDVVNIERDAFHGEWNYTVYPTVAPPDSPE